MARKADNQAEVMNPAARRPIRPFLTGVGLAAAWGALHLPSRISADGMGEFAAEIIAGAILSGGVLALFVEAAIAGVSWVRRRIRRSVSTVA